MKFKFINLQTVHRILGVQSHVVTSEKVISTVGGMMAIFCSFYITTLLTDTQGSLAILPSMGASTVLLFAVPHGQLSTPWAFFVGNLLSAAVGVTCALFIDNILLAAPVAVASSILIMHLSRSLHPPGGATALAAVIGGPGIAELEYGYVICPTLINCVVLFSIAICFNNFFQWRRYPQYFMRYRGIGYHPDTRQIKMRHIHEAIARSELVVDASDKQIKHIIDLADALLHEELIAGFELEMGAFYTNNKPGKLWSVRQVIDERQHENKQQHLLIYRVVEGNGKGQSDCCTYQEFAEWAAMKMAPARIKKLTP
ncbi:HPP family protein [Alteromonas sp. 14N.309.X.WAT.G.H12]|uniref:HPP family protein n=1 Tax=Alteromonas sp. 14N.309.X.WAT.G.H12 TaxID=3120824 RepID=UPI002FD5B777